MMKNRQMEQRDRGVLNEDQAAQSAVYCNNVL